MKETLRKASLSNTLEIEINPKLNHTLNPTQEMKETLRKASLSNTLEIARASAD